MLEAGLGLLCELRRPNQVNKRGNRVLRCSGQISVSELERRAVSRARALASASTEFGTSEPVFAHGLDLNQLATLLWPGSLTDCEGQATRDCVPAQPETATSKSMTIPGHRKRSHGDSLRPGRPCWLAPAGPSCWPGSVSYQLSIGLLSCDIRRIRLVRCPSVRAQFVHSADPAQLPGSRLGHDCGREWPRSGSRLRATGR